MKSLLKYIFIDRQFEFDGQATECIESIRKVKGLSFKELSDKKLKIYPWISIGTLVQKGGQSWIDGINVRADLADNDSAQTKITLLTTMRPEHYFIAAIFILFFLFLPLDKETIYNLAADWIIGHIWFQMVCRLQEELLVRKLTKRLRLVKM